MAMAAKRSWDVAWRDRAREEAANLNPAFCAELLSRTVSEYFRLREAPFPYAVAFLLLPIILHKRTRELLPGNSSAAFVSWIAEKRPQLAEMPERVARLMPVSREALLFSLQHRLLKFDQGGLVPDVKRISPRVRPQVSTDDTDEARRAAALLGRWFATQGSTTSILHGFGITP